MKAFSELFGEDYNTLREQWENSLKIELKTEDTSGKVSKKHIGLGHWPTLSLNSPSFPLKSQTAWKKASQTYFSTIEAQHLIEDLEGGVRVFFFRHLSEAQWNVVEPLLVAHADVRDIEVVVLEGFLPASKALKVIGGKTFISAHRIHEGGGHNVQELAALITQLVENLENKPTHVGVNLDSHFFKNIAKVRALKLLLKKIAEESESGYEPRVVALNSYREWTLYERFSNILRNNAQVASGLISGADLVQSSGYEAIFELEAKSSREHLERSLRMARNTSHILSLESTLGVVEDAAFGSYHVESLSHRYAEEAWKLMQTLLRKDPETRAVFLAEEISKVREERLERVMARKDVLAGLNDFPDAKEKLGVELQEGPVFRVTRCFEELRLKVEKMKNPPKVQILLKGDYASLSARINFVKNYFEVIGLEVLDPMNKTNEQGERILVLCAKDEDYEELSLASANEKAIAKYVAGKVSVPGYDAIHAGQNVLQVLVELTMKLGV